MYKPVNYYTLFKKDGIFNYACYTPDGKRVQRSTGRKKKAEALEVINERIMTGRLVYPVGFVSRTRSEVKVNPEDQTLGEYSEPFFDYDRCPIIRDDIARGKSPSRDLARNNRGIYRKHVIPIFGNTLVSDLNRTDINAWLLGLPHSGKITPVSANKVFRLLKRVLDRAVFDGIIEHNPCFGIAPLHEDDSNRDAFTKEEVERILHSDKFRYPMCRTACYVSASTGMRASEIRALKGYQIKDDFILVDSSEADLDGRKCTKNGETREVPITKAMHNELMKYYRGDDEYLFTFDGETPVAKRFFNDNLQEVLELEGMKREGLVFHSFRCFLDTQLISAGVNPETVRLVLGHKDEKMTKRYLHQKAEDKRDIFNKVDVDALAR